MQPTEEREEELRARIEHDEYIGLCCCVTFLEVVMMLAFVLKSFRFSVSSTGCCRCLPIGRY